MERTQPSARHRVRLLPLVREGLRSLLLQPREACMDETRVERFHGVRFYDSTEQMAGIVAAFLGAGFITHEPALVIATPSHRRAIAHALTACSFSVDLLQQSGNLLLLDASDTLSTLLVHDAPDPVRFESAFSRRFARLG